MTDAGAAPAAPRPTHLSAIDGLRAVAAISVLGYHAWLYTLPVVQASKRDGFVDYVWHEGRLGLVLFFVLSGFLLYGPWVRAAREGLPDPRVVPYFVRRAARIVPAYWLAIVGSIALLWWHDDVPGVRLPPASDLWLFPIFGQNFREATLLKLDAPMWTLAIEASFYVVLPLLGWFALRARRVGIWLVPIVFALAGLAYNYALSDESGLPGTVSKILPAVTPYFALGMLAAVVGYGRSIRPRPMWALIGVGALVVVGHAYLTAEAGSRGSHDQWLRIWRDDLGAFGFALIVVAVACAVRPPAWLVARPVAWVGQVSYGIYLWHVPVMLVLRAYGLLPLSPVPAIAVALAPTLLIAAASWRWVELPMQERARRWVQSRPRT